MLAGLIPKGEVDERSIADVSAADLRGFKRWHLFSGIGGWALALRIAGWPDDREIWTGSAPCQSFSVAGKGAGFDDPRDLWPHMFQLMRAIRPAVAMGEQVYAAVGKGWLDRVHADMEGAGYAVGSLGAPACAVNAPHRRDRLWWCAEDRSGEMDGGDYTRLERLNQHGDSSPGWTEPDRSIAETSGRCNTDSIDADADASERRTITGRRDDIHGTDSRRQEITGRLSAHGAWDHSAGDDADAGSSRRWKDASCAHGDESAHEGRAAILDHVATGSGQGSWGKSAWIICHDGKARRVGLSESGIRSLVDDGRSGRGSSRLRTGIDAEITPLLAQGVKSRVGKLRGFGNMIVPSLAAELISAYMECRPQGTT